MDECTPLPIFFVFPFQFADLHSSAASGPCARNTGCRKRFSPQR